MYPPPTRTALPSSRSLVLLTLLAAACTGSIGDAGPGRAGPGGGAGTGNPGTGNPGTGTGGNGNGAAPGAGNGAGNPGDPGPPPIDLPTSPADPGRVSLRRLNRAEYNLTVRDLLGTTSRPADAFEADLAGFGYDNNGDVQTLTTLQVDQYQNAAEALASEALAGGLEKFAGVARAQACTIEAAGCLRGLVAAFAGRAWRRPVTEAEVGRLLELAAAGKAQGEDTLGQLRLAVAGVLSSPHFYFKVELDERPDALTPHPVGPYELASRLSYLIYRSMPDQALFDAAAQGRLATADDVEREARRMLADPRGAELLGGFVGQWLDVNSLERHEVDPVKVGVELSRELAVSMQEETRRFVSELLEKNLPAEELLTARWSFLDARLAAHYGLPAPAGAGLTRVELGEGSRRRGLLTQAAVLTATSNPDRTSPVARGAWVLTHLLCAPPPPPPPDVPGLPESMQEATTARQQLEQHRANPGCAACHALMDPIGLGLENYDAIGRWRDREGTEPIDSSGVLPDGARFSGALELAEILRRDPRVPACVGANLYTYAVSRQALAGTVDGKHVERIVAGAGGAGARLRDLVVGIVTSDPFRLRRGEAGSGAPATSGGQP